MVNTAGTRKLDKLMSWKRREFLGLASGGLLSTTWPALAQPQQAEGIRAFSILLTGVHPSLPVNALGSLIFAFLSQGVALSVEVAFEDFAKHTPDRTHPLLAMLSDTASQNRTFVEIVPASRNLMRQTGYFKARSLWGLRSQIDQQLPGAMAAAAQPAHFSTVSTNELEGELRQDGLRTGGCTTVIYDAVEAAEREALLGPAAVLMLPLKARLDLRSAQEKMTSGLFSKLGDGTVLAVDVAELPIDPARAYEVGQRIAASVNRARLSGYLLSVLPREIYKRCCAFLPNHSRHYVILPEFPGSAEGYNGLLDQARTRLGTDCVTLVRGGERRADGAFLVETRDGEQHRLGAPGLGPDGEPIEGPIFLADDVAPQRGDVRHPDAVFVHKAQTVSRLSAKVPAANGICLNYPTGIVDPAHELLLEARDTLRDSSLSPEAPVFDAAMMADAELAYSYLEQAEMNATGLALTVRKQINGKSFNNSEITMWDVGSLILGLLAAVELELAPADRIYRRIKKIMASLPVIQDGDAAYPPTLINVRDASIERRGFDACDFARLTSAVTRAAQHTALADASSQLMGKWQIAGLMQGGVLNNILKTRIQSSYLSHCAHYQTRVLPALGQSETRSPYREAFAGETVADRTVNLLYTVDKIGILPTEPLLLEYVELGPSAECAVLTDVFLGAMKHHFDQTGQLLAPSETPIDTAPWFVYQGFDLGHETRWNVSYRKGREVVFEPVASSPYGIFSTKAAYLWYAVRPCRHTRKMLDMAQEHARIDGFGMSSGLFLDGYAQMKNHADLNTNGIVLQALAHLKRRTR
ncbi:DUF3131 domain-containing protein [Phaeobacter sp. HS012]|nr:MULTISPECIES: DUF3131 domain-containing protein [Phaeobacter]MBQ4808917.1 DUF3131 domain-containing protein [Phaeobacter sp. HS012]MBQ4883767.1 DUF3131 domain-containing protein [Phaeobacter sp. HS011]UWR57672.1 DUF3131 domain-containing protein [Phaeobacter inhibens]